MPGPSLDPSLPPAAFFEIAGCAVFVMWPKALPEGRDVPWIWYAPTLLPHLPDVHMAWLFERFLEAGVAVVGVDVGESYGSPRGTAGYAAAYRLLTEERGFARRVGLLPRSRGGLMLYNWAARNPKAVACIAGIYPVCDLRSYPGLEKAAAAFGMTPAELAAHLGQYNPVDLLAPLAAAQVPIWHIHGDQDTLVPLAPNSEALIRRYCALGGPGRLAVAEGQGHNLWEGFFCSRELVDFMLAHVTGTPASRGGGAS